MGPRTLLVAAAAALGLAAPAAAETVELVAYGEGVTTCLVRVTATDEWGQSNAADGTTTCSTAIEQSGQVRGHVPGVSTGSLCSGLRTACESYASWHDYDEEDAGVGGTPEATYDVALRAPLGQGWVAPADRCSGVGTDNLRCTFTARSVLLWVST